MSNKNTYRNAGVQESLDEILASREQLRQLCSEQHDVFLKISYPFSQKTYKEYAEWDQEQAKIMIEKYNSVMKS